MLGEGHLTDKWPFHFECGTLFAGIKCASRGFGLPPEGHSSPSLAILLSSKGRWVVGQGSCPVPPEGISNGGCLSTQL